jgi:hypothetical protein
MNNISPELNEKEYLKQRFSEYLDFLDENYL